MQPSAPSELATAYQEWMKLTQRIVELQRKVSGETVSDYTFAGAEGPVTLSELFGDRDELMIVHNMGRSCAYCTLWADGFNGMLGPIESRAAFALISPDPPEAQREFAKGRGWKFRMASAQGTNFIEDMGYGTKASPGPGYSCFGKSPDGKITRSGHSPFGPGDLFCPPWHLFELLPKGLNGWGPKFKY